MINQTLLYIGSGLTLLWGIAHLFPTRSVVQGFGEITIDNKRIITMEWIIEGIFLIFIGLLCAGSNFLYPASFNALYIYLLSSIFLVILAIVSLLTGFKINFLPFKLCPLIFSVSAILIISGALL